MAQEAAGRPRRFADDVGVGIVCAARLLELGLRHERIRSFLSGLLKLQFSKSKPSRIPSRMSVLVTVLVQGLPALAELGGSLYVRMRVAEPLVEAPDPDSAWPVDTGWCDPETLRRRPADYVPMTVVRIDLGQVRRQVFGDTKRAG